MRDGWIGRGVWICCAISVFIFFASYVLWGRLRCRVPDLLRPPPPSAPRHPQTWDPDMGYQETTQSAAAAQSWGADSADKRAVMDWEPDDFHSPNAASNSARKEDGYDLTDGSADDNPEDDKRQPPYATFALHADFDSNSPDLEPNTLTTPLHNTTRNTRKKTVTFEHSPHSTPSPQPSATTSFRRASTPRPANGTSTPSSPAPTPESPPPTPPPHKTLALFPPAVPYTLPRPRFPPTSPAPAPPNSFAAAFPRDHCMSAPAGTNPGTREAGGGSMSPALRSTPTVKPKRWASRRTAPKQTYFRWEFGVRIAGRVCGPRGEGGWGGRAW